MKFYSKNYTNRVPLGVPIYLLVFLAHKQTSFKMFLAKSNKKFDRILASVPKLSK